MKNWKTTGAGIGAILVAVGTFLSNGNQIDGSMISAIVAGIGLILAKDAEKGK
jgi:hypothetical protein